MRICILDGYEANPGDVSWEPITSLGSTSIYDESAPCDIVPRLLHHDVLVLNRIRVDEVLLQQLPDLKMITTLATGYNQIDLQATAAGEFRCAMSPLTAPKPCPSSRLP